MNRFIFALLFLVSILCACAVASAPGRVANPRSTFQATPEHDHAVLMNVHGLLTQMEGMVRDGIPQKEGDPKKLPAATIQAFNLTANSFNAASKAWDDYQLVVRTNGDKAFALRRFRELLSAAVDNGAELERLRVGL